MNARKSGVPKGANGESLSLYDMVMPCQDFKTFTCRGNMTKEIPGYEGLYSVTENGVVTNIRTNKPLKREYGKTSKYPVYALCKNGKRKRRTVSRIVAMAFLPIDNCDNLVVDHIDGNIENNHVSNLQWITQRENIHRSYRIMTQVRNYRKCCLYEGAELRGEFRSVVEACRFAAKHFGVSFSSLNKYRKANGFEVRCND